MKSRITNWILRCAVLLVIIYVLLFDSEFSTRPETHVGYIAWKHGFGSVKPVYETLFFRDSDYRDSFLEAEVETLRAKFPGIISGTKFGVDTYRGKRNRTGWEWYGDGIYDRYWINGDPEKWGWAFDTKNGKIKQFIMFKG